MPQTNHKQFGGIRFFRQNRKKKDMMDFNNLCQKLKCLYRSWGCSTALMDCLQHKFWPYKGAFCRKNKESGTVRPRGRQLIVHIIYALQGCRGTGRTTPPLPPSPFPLSLHAAFGCRPSFSLEHFLLSFFDVFDPKILCL